MATEDDFAHIWYADGNGNVTGYVVNGGDIASTIIDAYNEHFGTDISIWTPEKNTLQVGGTVPNWNAYEKIRLRLEGFYKYDISGGSAQAFNAMIVENGIVKVYAANTEDGNNLLVYSNTGSFMSSESYASFLDSIANIAQTYENYRGIERIQKEGVSISNWSQYKQLG